MTEEVPRVSRSSSARMAEMLLIVVSILLAFTLESWWERQSDARAHRELTLLLHADFVEAREQLRSNILRGETLVATGQALMEALADPSAVSVDSLKTLFPSIMRPVEPVSAPASYQAAMSSGAITILGEPGLFRALSAVDRAQIVVDTYWRLSADIHYTGALADVERSIGSLRVLRAGGAPSRFVPADFHALVSRPEIYSAARLVVQSSRNLLGSLRSMDSAMTAVIDQLDVSGPR